MTYQRSGWVYKHLLPPVSADWHVQIHSWGEWGHLLSFRCSCKVYIINCFNNFGNPHFLYCTAKLKGIMVIIKNFVGCSYQDDNLSHCWSCCKAPRMVGSTNGICERVMYWISVRGMPRCPNSLPPRTVGTELALVLSSSDSVGSDPTWGWPWICMSLLCWKYRYFSFGEQMADTL